MPNVKQTSESGLGKHGIARRMAEDALRLQAAGDTEQAERLLNQAQHTDADAVMAVLQERDTAFAGDALDNRTSDRDVRLAGQDGSARADAPSRSGINGTGSGADSERR